MSRRRGFGKKASSRTISRSLSPVRRNKTGETRGRDVSFFTADWRIISIYASSHDPRHPPTAVIEKDNSFWSSTGLYPQQFDLTLSLPVRIKELTIRSGNIRELSLQGRAVRNQAYKEIIAKSYKRHETQELKVSLEKAGPLEQLRLVILDGLEDFCSIQSISLNGISGRGMLKSGVAPSAAYAAQHTEQRRPKKKTTTTLDVGSIKGNIQTRSPAAPLISKPVYSTYVRESDIIMQPIGHVWEIIAAMDFSSWMQNVHSTSLASGPSVTATGSLIGIKYKDGSRWTVRLVAISEDQHYVTWELVAAESNLGYTSRIDTLELKRCSKENWTFVEWRTDFSSDASLEVIEDARHKRLEAFDHLESAALKAAQD